MRIQSATRCFHGSTSSPLISEFLGVCAQCLRHHFDEVLPHLEEVHHRAREPFSLPGQVPQGDGVPCQLCANNCCIPEQGKGFCGLRFKSRGKLEGAKANSARVSWYYDPLPTNCVADWACLGGMGVGYPRWAYRPSAECGFKNLAVFYEACSFDCLFCQNWHFRASARGWVSAEELASQVDEATSCICYFGGDPSPQLPHAQRASRLALHKKPRPILRIRWETNGSMHPALLQQAAQLSIASLNPEIPYALLAFAPQFLMRDLPPTSRRHAQQALEAGQAQGLKRVRVGNLHLLGYSY